MSKKLLSAMVIWGTAMLSALSVALMIKLGSELFLWFQYLQKNFWWALLIWTPLATMAIVFLLRKYAPGAAGTGSPQALIGTNSEMPESKRGMFLSCRIALAKIFLTPCAFLAGLSLGNEGPAVQVGASVMHLARSYTKNIGRVSVESLIMVGNGIGLAVCFGSALGGLFFCVERMSGTFFKNSKILMTAFIMLAAVIHLEIFGNVPYYGFIKYEPVTPALLIPALCVLILSAILGHLWIEAMIFGVNHKSILGRFRAGRPLLVAGVCGSLVSILGLCTLQIITGTSETATRDFFDSQAVYAWWFVPAKFLACVLTSWSGVSAGMFIPMINIGGGIGALISKTLCLGYSANIAALGMVSFLAYVSRSPLASVMIIADITGSYQLLAPELLMAVVSCGAAMLFSQDLWNSQVDIMLSKLQEIKI